MFQDYYKPQAISKKKTKKLEGHVKLTLKNAETGKIEKIVEGDNIVTDAISDLCDTCDYFGCTDYTTIMPIYQKMFGGCLLLKNPFDTDAEGKLDRSDYFIKGQHINPVVAHAGDTIPTDLGEDTTRGFPNTALQVKNKDSIKLSWEWTATQGNGEIAAVALCRPDVGNLFTINNTNAFKNFSFYQNVGRESLIANTAPHIKGQLDEKTAFTFTFDGEDMGHLKIEFLRNSFNEVGLTETNSTITTSQVFNCYNTYLNRGIGVSYAFDEDDKTLWLFCNWFKTGTYSSRVYDDRVYFVKLQFEYSNSAWSVIYADTGIVNFEVHNLYSLNIANNLIPHQKKKLDDGTLQDIFYLPTGTDNITGLKRFNFQNRSDTTEITFNEPIAQFEAGMCGKYDGDVFEVYGRLVNGLTGYKIKNDFEYFAITKDLINPNKIASANLSLEHSTIYENKFFYTTKFNLKESVNKTSAQMMIVEYTLREVDEYDES